MTQYLLSVHYSEHTPELTPEEQQQAFRQVDTFNEEIVASGTWVFGGGLQPPEIATVVRTSGGETVMTDGPFAETKEQLGGFWVIDAADLDVALELGGEGLRGLHEPGRGASVPGRAG